MPETVKAKLAERVELSLIFHPQAGYMIGLSIRSGEHETTYALDQTIVDILAKNLTLAAKDLRKEILTTN